MSIIRPWTNGDQVALSGLGEVPVVQADKSVLLYDANGLPWVQDTNAGMPVNIIGLTPTELNGAMPVNIQDQTSPTVIIPANQVIVSSTLATPTVIDAYTCTVADSTGMTIGDLLIVTSTLASPVNRFYWGRITNIAANVITVATPFDYAYESGQQASATTTNLGVDGSVTRQIFSLRAAEPVGGIDVSVDVTRVIFQCRTSSSTILSDFGDITGGLLNGLTCRKTDGTYENVFTVRSNDEIQGIAYDYDPTTTTGQGQNGFSSRLTFGGQNKLGVVKRIGPGEDLQFLISDDLSSLEALQIMIMGHIVI